MIDLDALFRLMGRLEWWWVERDAWGNPRLWVRASDGVGHVVRDLDDRNPVDGLAIWMFENMREVARELTLLAEMTEVAST